LHQQGQALEESTRNKDLSTAEVLQRWSKTLLVWGPVAVMPSLEVVKAERIAAVKVHLRRRGIGAQQAAQVAERRAISTMPVSLEMCYQTIQEAIIKDAGGPAGKQALEGNVDVLCCWVFLWVLFARCDVTHCSSELCLCLVWYNRIGPSDF
jgi:hypothetical protein